MKTYAVSVFVVLAISSFGPQFSTAFAQDPRHLFVADSGSGNIYEFAPDGTEGVLTTATGRPYGLAFDTNGNLFLANFNGGITEIAPDGSQSVFASLFNSPASLAFDGTGNLLVGVFGNGYVFKYTTNGSQSTYTQLPDSGRPVGLAFDSTGQLFISDEFNGYLYRNGNVFASGLDDPWGIAFDSNSNLFEADNGSGDINKFASVGGVVSSSYTTFASGLDAPFGLAFDSTNNLFVTDYNAGAVYEFNTNASRTTFASGLGAPSALVFGPLITPRGIFGASPTSGVAPLPVHFTPPTTDNLGHALTAWNWDFGDGSNSTASNPSHTYASGGTFLIHLVATNGVGGTVFAAGPLINVSLPTVQFTATPTNGTAPVNTQFTCPGVDSSGSTITSWNWNFGDGSGSMLQNPSHTYVTPGQYVPTLIATNANGVEVIGSGPSISALEDFGLVANGGFETGDFTSWTTGGNFTHTSVSESYAHTGTYGAKLGSRSTAGYLSQTLTTTPGATYVLSFWLENPDGETPNEFFVTWAGTTNFDQTNIGDLDWSNIQLTVTASGTATVLQFGFWINSGDFGLDDISVKLAAPPSPVIESVSLSGTNLVINGGNGQSGSTYIVLSSANLAAPFSQWSPVATNTLNTSGDFTMTATNVVDPALPQLFFILMAR